MYFRSFALISGTIFAPHCKVSKIGGQTENVQQGFIHVQLQSLLVLQQLQSNVWNVVFLFSTPHIVYCFTIRTGLLQILRCPSRNRSVDLLVRKELISSHIEDTMWKNLDRFPILSSDITSRLWLPSPLYTIEMAW